MALGWGPKIAHITFAELAANPNYQYDDQATHEEQNQAEAAVAAATAVEFSAAAPKSSPAGPPSPNAISNCSVRKTTPITNRLTADVFKIWQYRLGLALLAGIITFIFAGYVARYQPRCVRNHARALAMAGLLLAMLLLTQVAGIGSSSLYIFGIAPTIVAAMILTIAYDQRFALGIATIHAIIVTTALDQGLDSFLDPLGRRAHGVLSAG